tara:strand:+ start:3368 stop:3730 length:363 start_codon:yes stop_codon:yes gene_type:complete
MLVIENDSDSQYHSDSDDFCENADWIHKIKLRDIQVKYGLVILFLVVSRPVLANDGPLLSWESAAHWGLWLIAIGVLLATIASSLPLMAKGCSAIHLSDQKQRSSGTSRAGLSWIFSKHA